METKLTLKQRRFANEYLEAGNATEAAMKAYKPKNRAVARSIGSENLTKPNIKRTIQEALEANGLTNDLLAQRVLELINARRKITYVKQGEVRVVQEIIDTQAVKAGIEFGLKLKAVSPEEQQRVVVIRYDQEREQLKEVLSSMRENSSENEVTD